ncbi:MAG: phosphocholine cytidylyltransferase family protein [Deltaproteobacteria bacterium]|nr:phosphocholine cytidylyltransferase family protein [Deltaproteobacteria bacterium]
MITVILSAGVGRRLAPLTDSLPKALIDIGGRPLLGHMLHALRQYGLTEVVLVVGHQRPLMEAAVNHHRDGQRIYLVYNERFADSGSLYSLWLARAYLKEAFVFMDADLLFNPQILAGLEAQPDKSCLLVGPLTEDSGEEVKVYHHQGQVTAIGKNLKTEGTLAGEALGIVKIAAPEVPLALELMAELVQANQQAEHEELSQALAQHQRIWVQNIGDLSWLEIDFPEDVIRARELVWPAIQQQLTSRASWSG